MNIGELKNKIIDINSKEYPLNYSAHKKLRQLYEKYDKYTIDKHNEWLPAYRKFCQIILT